MNLPLGIVKSAGLPSRSYNASAELYTLSQGNFSGYTIETLFGPYGVEESILLFRYGQGAGAFHGYYGTGQTFLGDAALPHVLNAFQAEHGTIDVIELSPQQIDLVTAFNSALKVTKPIGKGQFKNFLKPSFDASLATAIQKKESNSGILSKESLFKKFGLAGIDKNN